MSAERESIEQLVREAGYDPEAIGGHDLRELDHFRDVLALWREMKSTPPGDARRALARRLVDSARAGPAV